MEKSIRKGQSIIANIRVACASHITYIYKYEGIVQDICYYKNDIELIKVKLFTGNGDETFETYCGEGDIEFLPSLSRDLPYSNEDYFYDVRSSYFDKVIILRLHVLEKEKQVKVDFAWVQDNNKNKCGNPSTFIYDKNYLLDQVTISGKIYDIVNKAPIWYYISDSSEKSNK